jgi:hypothetical protein
LPVFLGKKAGGEDPQIPKTAVFMKLAVISAIAGI